MLVRSLKFYDFFQSLTAVFKRPSHNSDFPLTLQQELHRSSF